MSEVNWERVRRIMIQDKPTKRSICRIANILPKCRVHGFGSYGFGGHWYVLVEDDAFPEDPAISIANVMLEQLPSYTRKNIFPLFPGA